MPFEIDDISIKILIWISENIIKVLFGVGIVFTVVKMVFVVRSMRLAVFFAMKLYNRKFKTHVFYRKANEIRNKIEFRDINIQTERIELARHILIVEYGMLYNYTTEIIGHYLTPRKVPWYQSVERYETDPQEMRAYMVKQLNIMRLLSVKGLRIHDIPEPVIKKYSKYRNIIYDTIDHAIYTLTTEYQFTPLILWGFLNFSYILFTQLKNVITYFVASLNGELKDSKYYPPFPEI